MGTIDIQRLTPGLGVRPNDGVNRLHLQCTGILSRIFDAVLAGVGYGLIGGRIQSVERGGNHDFALRHQNTRIHICSYAAPPQSSLILGISSIHRSAGPCLSRQLKHQQGEALVAGAEVKSRLVLGQEQAR